VLIVITKGGLDMNKLTSDMMDLIAEQLRQLRQRSAKLDDYRESRSEQRRAQGLTEASAPTFTDDPNWWVR
jgi:CRP-like cAMP-binding protein